MVFLYQWLKNSSWNIAHHYVLFTKPLWMSYKSVSTSTATFTNNRLNRFKYARFPRDAINRDPPQSVYFKRHRSQACWTKWRVFSAFILALLRKWAFHFDVFRFKRVHSLFSEPCEERRCEDIGNARLRMQIVPFNFFS